MVLAYCKKGPIPRSRRNEMKSQSISLNIHVGKTLASRKITFACSRSNSVEMWFSRCGEQQKIAPRFFRRDRLHKRILNIVLTFIILKNESVLDRRNRVSFFSVESMFLKMDQIKFFQNRILPYWKTYIVILAPLFLAPLISLGKVWYRSGGSGCHINFTVHNLNAFNLKLRSLKHLLITNSLI